MHRFFALLLILAWSVGCSSSVNVGQERDNLMARDRDWSQSTKDVDKFMTFWASDASAYPPGMPVATGTGAIREVFTRMSSSPGFSVQWTPTKADVSASGDVGYTTGTYQLTMNGVNEKGKYVTVWKKQSDGTWKVGEDIFNADAGAPPSTHVMVAANSLTWSDPPPVLPPGAKMAVVAGDPSKAEPFALRLQTPAGWKVAPHWHPTDENVTVLSGAVALGMGDSFDQAGMKDLGTAGYSVIPAESHHYFLSKTAATIQVNGMGPFAMTYVNPADDPSKKQ
jgi:ketosteroid isomerase-like protein